MNAKISHSNILTQFDLFLQAAVNNIRVLCRTTLFSTLPLIAISIAVLRLPRPLFSKIESRKISKIKMISAFFLTRIILVSRPMR